MKTIEEIISAVTAIHKVTPERLLSRERSDQVAICRMHCAHMMKEAGYQPHEIGIALRRDRTSIFHQVRTFAATITVNKFIREKYELANLILQ